MTRRRHRTRTITLVALITTTLLPTTTATADPTPNTWQRLRDCESGNDYTAVSPHHSYYGAYQFDLPTWHSVGGTGHPNHATPTEQDYRALYLYRMRGWQPWSCAHTLHLRTDTDAASRRIPTYDDAAHMNTNPNP